MSEPKYIIEVNSDTIESEYHGDDDVVRIFLMTVGNDESFNDSLTSYIVEVPSRQHKLPDVSKAKQN